MTDLKLILEALLMSRAEPLDCQQMQQLFEEELRPSKSTLEEALDQLAKDYENRAIELVKKASGYCFQTRPGYAPWIARLFNQKPVKYSRALLEVLAIVAYRQPVTRADIEAIRGVAVSTVIMKTLLDREWIKASGTRDAPGKPTEYRTTKVFLDYFNLASLEHLPSWGRAEHEQ